MFRTRADLLALASRYANERRVPFGTIIKEILHYEILYAMAQSEALSQLTFQGGTALRLCYRGTLYSEDLDFACSEDFHTDAMKPFLFAQIEAETRLPTAASVGSGCLNL